MTARDRASAGRRRVLVPLLSAGLAFAVLVGLGTWQLERRAWKEGLIETLSERLAAPPAALPPPGAWARLDPAAHEFRRVAVRLAFPRPDQALVYTVGSALRPDVKGAGHWVVALGEAAGGRLLVNRGFLPRSAEGGPQAPPPPPAGPVDVVGVLRWPEARGWFTPADDPGRNLWFTRDPAAIAAGKDWGPVAPFYLELEAPDPPGRRPQAGPLRASLPNNHLQYALTWYGIAAMLVIVTATFLVTEWQNRRAWPDSA